MSLRGAIIRLRSKGSNGENGTYTVTRAAASTNDGHGRPVEGVITTFPIVASVQSEGAELQDEAEGRFSNEVIKVYTASAILVATDDNAGVAGDTLVWRGKTYQVKSVAVRESFGAEHCIATAAYIGTP